MCFDGIMENKHLENLAPGFTRVLTHLLWWINDVSLGLIESFNRDQSTGEEYLDMFMSWAYTHTMICSVTYHRYSSGRTQEAQNQRHNAPAKSSLQIA